MAELIKDKSNTVIHNIHPQVAPATTKNTNRETTSKETRQRGGKETYKQIKKHIATVVREEKMGKVIQLIESWHKAKLIADPEPHTTPTYKDESMTKLILKTVQTIKTNIQNQLIQANQATLNNSPRHA